MKPIGKVTHYYGKAGVAIVKLQEKASEGALVGILEGT